MAHSSTHLQQVAPSLFSTGMLPPARILNQRYRLIESVGRGGMGAVYSAQDTQLGDRLVALKEMSVDRLNPQDLPLLIGQFRREAHLLASLHHPYLPAIHEYFTENGRWYLVMSFIEGQNLQAVLNAIPGKKLPFKEVVRIGIELCEVLEYLHTHEPPIIFRDLKPLNIMMTPKGHICLIDFGIARNFKQEQTNDTTHFYSVGYAPPEQYGQSQTSPRSDIYSLGATLHQMLSGQNPAQHPFQFSSLHLIDPTIPAPLVRLIMRMVEMNEQVRPTHVAEVKWQLEQILRPGQSGVIRSARIEPDAETLEVTSRSSFQGQMAGSFSHVSPTLHTPGMLPQSVQPSQEERFKERPRARRSILIGLLGGIAVVAGGGGFFALNHGMINGNPTKSSTRQTPVQASKPTPTLTAARSSMQWTDLHHITGQTSQTTPALAVSPNGKLDMAFMANNAGNGLLYMSSRDSGATWSNTSYTRQAGKAAPALSIAKNGTLHLVFVADNAGNGLLYMSSRDSGATWSNASYTGKGSKAAPALSIATNGTLYLVFVANNAGNSLRYTFSQDSGATWSNAYPIPGQLSKVAPALTIGENGTLHLVFVADNAGNGLLYTSSQNNGATWSNTSYTGQGSLLAPALAMLNNTLYLAFVDNDGSNQLCVISSQNGRDWTSKQKVGQSSLLAPALTVLNNTLYLAFVADDGSNQLCVISTKG